MMTDHSSYEKNQECIIQECPYRSHYHKHYEIPGSPIPLARARFGNKRVWDSQKQIRTYVGITLSGQHAGSRLFSGPLIVDLSFYFLFPTSWSVKKKQEKLLVPHACKPDLSNLIKFVEDVGSGILYKDDCGISHLVAKKVYHSLPRTVLIVSET